MLIRFKLTYSLSSSFHIHHIVPKLIKRPNKKKRHNMFVTKKCHKIYKIKVLTSYGYHDFLSKLYLNPLPSYLQNISSKRAFWRQWIMNKRQICIKNQDIKQKLKIQKTNKDPKHIFETHKDPNRKWNVEMVNNRQNK